MEGKNPKLRGARDTEFSVIGCSGDSKVLLYIKSDSRHGAEKCFCPMRWSQKVRNHRFRKRALLAGVSGLTIAKPEKMAKGLGSFFPGVSE